VTQRFTVARQDQQRAGEPRLARVEQLIDRILFDPDVPRQHVREKPIRESGREWSCRSTVLFLMMRSTLTYSVVNDTTGREGELYENQCDALAASVA
jgi:hypothetical protein